MDCFVASLLAMTDEHEFALSRRDAPEVCMNRPPPKREQGMPGARRTRGPVCKKGSETHTSIQVQSEHSGIPCAMA